MNANSAPTAQARAKHFGLRQLPFQPAKADSSVFLSASRQDALEFLNGRLNNPGVALLSGDGAVGKTAIVRNFLRTCDQTRAVAITLPQDGGVNLLREACKRFCSRMPEPGDVGELMQELSCELRTRAEGSPLPMLIVDQLERLTEDSAPSLIVLADQVSRGTLPLSLVLVCSPVHNEPSAACGMLLEPYVTVRQLLAPFTSDETSAYIATQIAEAGGREGIFANDAIAVLHGHSHGVSAEINVICLEAMRLAHRAGDRVVRATHVESVAAKRTRVEKSATKTHVMIRRSDSGRGAGSPLRAHTTWSSTSLADIGSGGYTDLGHLGLHSDASTPLHASAETGDTRRRISEMETGFDDLELRAGALDVHSERVAGLLDALDERIERAESAATHSWEAELRLRTLAESVAVHTEALQTRMTALLSVADSSQDLEESLRQLGASASALATAAHQRISDTGAALQKRLEEAATESVERITQQSAALQLQMDEATLLINERGPKFLRMAEHELQDAIRGSIAKLTPVRAEMHGLLAEGNVVVANVRSQFDSERQRAEHCLERMQSQTADRMIALSVVCERADGIRDNLERAASQTESFLVRVADTSAELERGRTEANTLASELGRAMAAARHGGDTLGSLCAAVEEKAQQLASHQAAARSLITQLTDVTISAADAAKVLEEKQAGVREQAEDCEARVTQACENFSAQFNEMAAHAAEQVRSKRSEIEALTQTLEERLAVVNKALDQSCSSAAAERDRLEAQVAAGISASAELQHTVNLAMSVREQMHSSTEDALMQTAKLQEVCKKTQDANASALESRKSLAGAEENAKASVARLLSESETAVAKLRGEVRSTLAESTSTVCAAAQRADETLRLMEAGMLKAGQSTIELSSAAEAARIRTAEIQGSRTALIESHRGLVFDAEALLHRVNLRVDALKDVDRQLAQYENVADDFSARLNQLEEQLCAAAAAVSQPQRILADAQAYAGQLERVCDAAKKVKTGVSQAALAADERARELTNAEQEAAHRLHELRQDLAAAAQTLAQWVQEADRAQTRLESTIQSCPPIGQTHAKQALQNLAGAAVQVMQTAQTTAKPAQRPAAPAVIGASQPPTREEEIASLLAEARKARKEVEGGARRAVAPEPKPTSEKPGDLLTARTAAERGADSSRP